MVIIPYKLRLVKIVGWNRTVYICCFKSIFQFLQCIRNHPAIPHSSLIFLHAELPDLIALPPCGIIDRLHVLLQDGNKLLLCIPRPVQFPLSPKGMEVVPVTAFIQLSNMRIALNHLIQHVLISRKPGEIWIPFGQMAAF